MRSLQRILVAGATSAIGGAVLRLWAREGAAFFLAARNPERLATVAADLRVRGAERVEVLALDLDDVSRHRELVEAASGALGGLDVVLVAHGVLPDQRRCEEDPREALRAIQTDFAGPVSLLLEAANALEAQGSGCLAVLGSVAGDRGRRSNYVYGSAKAGLDTFLQGLRMRLHARGVGVVLVKPGFVASPMTAHLPRGLLFAEPARIAGAIQRAIRARRPVVYVPGYWRLVMGIVRRIPEPVLRRLNF